VIDVHLLRHGAVDSGGRVYGARMDPPLSPAGRQEVDALQRRLGAGFDRMRLVCSPAGRAAETVTRLGLELATATVDPRFSERDLGVAEGGTWDELWALAPPAVTVDPAAFVTWTPPEGEGVAALRRRVVAALEELTQGPQATTSTLVVTHSGPIVCALAHTLDLDDATATRVQIGTATLTTLRRHDEGSWTVRAVGRWSDPIGPDAERSTPSRVGRCPAHQER
jgi:broad specificity phosphatase PhoE